jgi:hypothetical protein
MCSVNFGSFLSFRPRHFITRPVLHGLDAIFGRWVFRLPAQGTSMKPDYGIPSTAARPGAILTLYRTHCGHFGDVKMWKQWKKKVAECKNISTRETLLLPNCSVQGSMAPFSLMCMYNTDERVRQFPLSEVGRSIRLENSDQILDDPSVRPPALDSTGSWGKMCH